MVEEENKENMNIDPAGEDPKPEEVPAIEAAESQPAEAAQPEAIESVEEVPVVDEAKEENLSPAPKKAEKRWYVIQTYSGQEDQVKEAVERNIDQIGMRSKIHQILVPEEETVEVRGARKIEKKKKMFPGYVFIEMELDDESWYAIRQSPGVARFIGTKVKPTPVSDREMQRVLKQIGMKKEKLEVAFEKGETVRVISGPF
ncbi:MAG TPA: transcription termination/antitermination protein NusG, partial [Candidatus Omnitrophota bacterium]|nr:transcription termination/antitermination protein NusG [Candidatus Omnitrophota bacterium]